VLEIRVVVSVIKAGVNYFVFKAEPLHPG
jgi:hypothetical protein